LPADGGLKLWLIENVIGFPPKTVWRWLSVQSFDQLAIHAQVFTGAGSPSFHSKCPVPGQSAWPHDPGATARGRGNKFSSLSNTATRRPRCPSSPARTAPVGPRPLIKTSWLFMLILSRGITSAFDPLGEFLQGDQLFPDVLGGLRVGQIALGFIRRGNARRSSFPACA
jgi:hypothetical protein